ncbi:hypothetical protein EJB05_21636, partial [Eragrostis curvula]
MECLFHHFGKQGYQNYEVVNAYITLLRAVQHLRQREGGSDVLETSFVPPTMQHDGDEKVIMEEMYPDAKSRKRTFLNKRIKSYLNSDMVFLSINITDRHWYLAVINGKKGQLAGLQKQIEFVMKSCRLPNHKWKDQKVAEWPREEVNLGGSTQDDDCSCGLFMLNYMEYWTGEELSHSFDQVPVYQVKLELISVVKLHILMGAAVRNTACVFSNVQDNMAHFRTKLIAILLTDELNIIRECPYTEPIPDEDVNPDDVVLIEKDDSPWKEQRSGITDVSAAAKEDPDQPGQTPDGQIRQLKKEE